MSMKSQLAFIFLPILLSMASIAATPNSSGYRSGFQWAKEKAEILQKEGGKWVNVPANYNNPNLGEIAIYYATTPNFNPELPTVIYIQGGPGGSSHGWYDTFSRAAAKNKLNIVIFDVRGIAFSRPESEELYQNSALYNSNFVARDMAKIIGALGLKKWSVWGSSYGTIPATIFASLYPQLTASLILEGTVFDDWTSYQLTEYYLSLLNKSIYKKLNDNGKYTFGLLVQKLMPYLINSTYDLGDESFEGIVRALNTSDFTETSLQATMAITSNASSNTTEITAEDATKRLTEKLNETIDELLDIEYLRVIKAIVRTQLGNLGITPSNEEVYERSKIQLKIMSKKIQEPPYDSFQMDAQVHKMFKSNEGGAKTKYFYNYSQEYGFKSETQYLDNPNFSEFQAKDYPLSIPVTYFQGGKDYATNITAAVKHFKKVAKGKKQMVIFPHGGHGPNLNLFNSKNDRWISEVFLRAVNGQEISATELNPFITNEAKSKVVTTGFFSAKNSCSDSF